MIGDDLRRVRFGRTLGEMDSLQCNNSFLYDTGNGQRVTPVSIQSGDWRFLIALENDTTNAVVNGCR